METLKCKYTDAKFVNLSISSLRMFGLSCSSFIEMCDTLGVNMGNRRYLVSKLSNTIIQSAYCIFYRRSKPWNSPELLPSKIQSIIVLFLLLSLLNPLLPLEICFIIIRLANCNYLFE